MFAPVGIDAVQDRFELIDTHILALEVVQAASITLDLGRLLFRLPFELIDDLPSAIVEWDQSDYSRHRRGW